MRAFITGITGTLGTALVEYHRDKGDMIFGCARNESKVVDWLRDYGRDATLLISDSADLSFPNTDSGRLLPSIDRVYHCAAMKHVDLCEKQPEQAVYQNVQKTHRIAIACRNKVELVFVSSDKACLPQGVYGSTKLIAERIVLGLGGAVVRFGNLIGSSGSVFKLWKEAIERGEKIKLTDPEMTRYFYPVASAAKFLAEETRLECVSIPLSMFAAKMGDVANAIAGDQIEIVGLRPGETKHQWLIAPGDRIEKGEKRILLHDRGKISYGFCSKDDIPRWDIQYLLQEAGL